MHRYTWLLGLFLAGIALNCAPQDPNLSKGVPLKGPEYPAEKKNDGVQITPLPNQPNILKERLEAARDRIRSMKLLSSHGFWTVFHGILGQGLENTMLEDEKTKKMVNAIDYISKGGDLKGLNFAPTGDGVDVQKGLQFEGQGHQDQFIAEMAQWGMKLDHKIKVLGKDYTFADFVNHSKMKASTTGMQELSWAMLVIGQFFGPDYSWTNSMGEKISVEDMVRYELDQPMDIAACGGTHRLFGLSWVYHLHRQKGGQREGVWKECADKLDHYKSLAKQYQNPNGLLSTNYFKGAGFDKNRTAQISTTGHILEWLTLAMTDEELKHPWVEEAANALCQLILQQSPEGIESGALYHATHGLLIYHARRFGDVKDVGPLPLAGGYR